MIPRQLLKTLLARLGSRLSDSQILGLNAVVNYIEVGWWVRRHGFRPEYSCATREESFAKVGEAVRGKEVLYLEFGVGKGASLRQWARILEDPRSKLHGFDTFEGLPHDWTIGRPAGLFSQGGDPPLVDDERVQFHKGLFQDVLPNYRWPENEQLIVHLDADLYSSTAFVLEVLESNFPVGSYLLFDEFHSRADELRAFDEFLTATRWKFRMVGATKEFVHVAFQRIG